MASLESTAVLRKIAKKGINFDPEYLFRGIDPLFVEENLISMVNIVAVNVSDTYASMMQILDSHRLATTLANEVKSDILSEMSHYTDEQLRQTLPASINRRMLQKEHRPYLDACIQIANELSFKRSMLNMQEKIIKMSRIPEFKKALLDLTRDYDELVKKKLEEKKEEIRAQLRNKKAEMKNSTDLFHMRRDDYGKI